MPGYAEPFTQQELDATRRAIEKAGHTLEKIGRVRLGRLVGVTANRADGLLRKLREGGTAPQVDEINRPKVTPKPPSKLDDLAERLENLSYSVPEWTTHPRSGRPHQVIPVVQASDWHLDEVVNPEQINWKNGFNRPIAEMRVEKFFQNSVKVCREYLKGFEYPGVVLACCGDMFSGSIWEELKATNADQVMSSLIYWLPKVEAGLKLWAQEFGKVWITWVVGNHGRNTVKPIFKGRVRDNWDWMFGRLLQRDMEGDTRISWAIAEGARTFFNVYGTRFTMTHGDECKGGTGISGLLSPLMLADARARKNHAYDYWLLGHWHQRASFKRVKANGTLKGFDEYVAALNFECEPPQQSLFVVDPVRGPICDWPIFVADDNEPWRKEQEQAELRAA